MSFSFVIIDKLNKFDINKTNDFLKQNYSDYEVLYCSSKKVQNLENVKNFIFDEGIETESIINSVVNKTSKQNIVVIRKFVKYEKIKKIADNIKSQDSIVYFKKEYKGVKRFFCNILKKLAKLIYSRDITFASHAVVGYGQNPSIVLKELEYPSNAMRKFSWVGITNIEIDGDEKYNLCYNKTKMALKTFMPLALTIILLVVYVLFRTKIPALGEIAMLFAILIGLFLFVIYGLNWFIKSQIGENTNGKADFKE